MRGTGSKSSSSHKLFGSHEGFFKLFSFFVKLWQRNFVLFDLIFGRLGVRWDQRNANGIIISHTASNFVWKLSKVQKPFCFRVKILNDLGEFLFVQNFHFINMINEVLLTDITVLIFVELCKNWIWLSFSIKKSIFYFFENSSELRIFLVLCHWRSSVSKCVFFGWVYFLKILMETFVLRGRRPLNSTLNSVVPLKIIFFVYNVA